MLKTITNNSQGRYRLECDDCGEAAFFDSRRDAEEWMDAHDWTDFNNWARYHDAGQIMGENQHFCPACWELSGEVEP